MSDHIPGERLQPCLLDRLTDDEPTLKEESRSQRVISRQKYIRGVLRDLDWLFNTNAYLHVEGYESFRLSDFPHAFNSVLNFGARQLCGLTAPDMDRLQRDLEMALKTFEPRIGPQTLEVQTDLERNIVTLSIKGVLWANPSPEQLDLKTTVDLETDQCLLGDSSAHG